MASKSGIPKLLSNSREIFIKSSETLIKIAINILSYPGNEKYRQIRLSNPNIERLIQVPGVMECFEEMGFNKSEDGFLKFPQGKSTNSLLAVKNQLEETKARLINSQHSIDTTVGASSNAANSNRGASGNSSTSSMSRPNTQLFVKELGFYQKVHSSFNHVLIYEDRTLQVKARNCIPTAELERKAGEKLKQLKEANDDKNADLPGFRELLLLELLEWFKNSFFSWVDSPNCDRCAGKTTSVGMVNPTEDDQRWGANRVENYLCNNCGNNVRFPRYNHPGKLLETRRGRCGEWANCFTLCCRAMNFEARYTLDWTDHVWTEVYSDTFCRWLHCDPCENACDKPLTYEVGWGKKLTYVISFSKDDIQDVTPRYTVDQNSVLSRRTECRESWLIEVLEKLRNERQKDIPNGRKKELERRMLNELIEFLRPKEIKEGEQIGRLSGSLEWRLSRSEAGNQKPQKFVFKLSKLETASKHFHLTYNCAKDVYTRASDNNSVIKAWKSGVFESENIARKEETDWKKVYLARIEGPDGSKTGRIVWKFDFAESGLVINDINIKVSSNTFESGKIRWSICSGDSCFPITSDKEMVISSLNGSKVISLEAVLTGGNGNCAFQHTQLFRQDSDSEDLPFKVEINLSDST